MQFLVTLIVVSVLPIIGFFLGVRLARSGNMTRHERRELEARRDFMADLAAKAAEHAMLGDNFAVIVQGTLADERRKLR